MKNILLLSITSVILCFVPAHLYSQIITLGNANNFALFTTVGAVTNVGISQVTGHVGSNIGGSTTFGNVNGRMHDQDTASASCAIAVLAAYGQLNALIPAFALAPIFGNGDTLVPGVYARAGAGMLNQTLYLNANGNPAAVFVIQVQGACSSSTNAKVKLINGALACNVFWKVEGEVTVSQGVSMKGTIIANGGPIHLLSLDTLEGRALAINGAIDIHDAMVSTPIGCGSPILLGPALPTMGSLMCYTLFSAIGPVVNAGVTNVVGDVGSNSVSTTGFDSLLVKGIIHKVPDTSTANAATALTAAYNQMNAMVEDIKLLYPAQFGRNLVLTPHTYLMNGAVELRDTLFLNAMGRPDATFVIKCYGAFSALANSRVILINGAQAKNVYWMVNGAVSILDSSIFNGSIICNSGAMDLTINSRINGRALTTTGALNISAATAIMPPGCGPDIIKDPINDTICLGDTAMFIVSATGSGLTFKWRKGSVDLINGLRIQGVSNDTLFIFPTLITDSASDYNVIVTGLSASDTSVNAALIIGIPTLITTEPLNLTVCAGSPARFIVNATGTNLTYQWRKGNVGFVDGILISGAQNDTFTINLPTLTDTASNYNVIVSGQCGINDTSNFVQLSVNAITMIIAEPANQTVCNGDSVSFTVTALGSGLTYEWRRGNTALANTASISGVATPTLTIKPTAISDSASNYNVIVSGVCGINDTSINVTLIVNSPPIITAEPVNQLGCVGNAVNLSVTATGTALSYQWFKGNSIILNGGSISGAGTANLVINPSVQSDTGSNYRVVVSGACTPNDTSNMASVILNTSTLITAEPINQTVCNGDSVSFTVTASGSGLTYKWRKGSTDLINTVSISGVATPILTIKPTAISDAALNYNVIVSGACGVNDTSINATLIVNSPPIITAEPVNQLGCVGNAINLSVTATGTALSYQWFKGNSIILNGGSISGAGTANLVINPSVQSDTGSNYRVVVSGACTPNDTSNMASVILNTPALITAEPVNQTVCEGSSVSFSVTATGTGLTYTWRNGNTVLANGAVISGVATSTLTFSSATQGDVSIAYNVIVGGTCAVNDTSVMVSLNLNSAPVITVEPTNKVVCVGDPVTMAIEANGTLLTYQWYKGSTALTNGGAISGAQTSILSINPSAVSDTASNYYVVVSGACAPNATSVFVSLVVNVPPVATAISNTPVCTDDTLQLSTLFITGATYSWTGPNGFTSPLQTTTIVNATTFHQGVYSVVVTTNGCASLPASVSVAVNDCVINGFFIPEGFSPNGDGYNDVFVIRGGDQFPNSSINIYNRWGVKVYAAAPYTGNWDGTTTMGVSIGGSALPVGTYFYTLDLGDGSKVIQGSIYLNR
ncbi:MAG: ice-binding family protein [Bacteroidota bacterium]